jgi:asparaginyl-tRNA synthetase
MSASTFRLRAPGESYQTRKVALAAALAGVELSTSLQEDPAALAQLVPHGKSLILEVQSASSSPLFLARSNVALRFLAENAPAAGLYGETVYEAGLVDQWLDFSFNSLEVPATVLRLPAATQRSVSDAVKETARREVLGAVGVLDKALGTATFLAGDKLTLADVAVFCALHDLLVCGKEGGAPTVVVDRFPGVWRWFLTLLYQPLFQKVAAPNAAATIKVFEARLPKVGSSMTGGGNGAKHSSSEAGGDKKKGRAAAGAGAVAAKAACSKATDNGSSSSSSSSSTGASRPPLVLKDGPASSLFQRGRTVIKEILVERGGGVAVGETVTIKGWARTIREGNKGALLFIELNDGSTAMSMQAVLEAEKTEGFEDATPAKCGGVGASFEISGMLVKSPAKGQEVELHATQVVVLGKVYGGDNGEVGGKLYPLSKKAHSMEYLRTNAHLRARTRVTSSVMRVRHAMAYATHKFFNDRGFKYVHTPLITGADCEGAGEMFTVTTLLPDKETPKLPTLPDGSIDFSKDFFGKRTSLTVSGQLNVETYACGLSDVYTFGPTFRAENSHTTRHLAEFWMIEPEIAFADLEMDMALAEDYLKYCVWYALTHNEDDLVLLEKVPGGEVGLRDRLRNVLENPFVRITYTEAVAILERDLASKKVSGRNARGWEKKRPLSVSLPPPKKKHSVTPSSHLSTCMH